MAGKIITNVPLPCACDGKPNPSAYGAGTQWQCDNCKSIWTVVMSRDDRDHGARYWSQK